MKNFSPSASEVQEKVGKQPTLSMQEAKHILTTEHVLAEIRDIHDNVAPFNAPGKIKRLCEVLDYLIRTGAIKP